MYRCFKKFEIQWWQAIQWHIIQLFQPEEQNVENIDDKYLDHLNALLYILDGFNISQDAYRELSALFQNILRCHNIVEKKNLNQGYQIVNTPDGLGVQKSPKQRLKDVLSELLLENNNMIPENNLKIKISGDGTRVGKRIQILNVPFNIVNEGLAH